MVREELQEAQAPARDERPVSDIDEVPGSILDPNVVRAAAMRQVREILQEEQAPARDERPVSDIDEVPGSIFDPNVVRAAAMRQLQEMEDRHNFGRKQVYLRAVRDYTRNLRHNPQLKQAPPAPPLMVHYGWVENDTDNDPEVTEGPEYVAEPFQAPLPVAPPPQGIVSFGPPAGDGLGSYLVGGTNTVEPGAHGKQFGREFVLIQIGRPGMLNYRQLWVLVHGDR
jgi:hypothetical protein